ncbi:extracellular solute-binding protein [Lysinibacter sp. HNR]|uniref:ABC transporter substrate-binding protein n=1 Tax=Lysinibacter sp. HNR TaxID=3031408 RepID=UPI0024357324|nr:extracellular solute-binding protein [Lysinibacter sp. HNR]WGD37224.1 extracellular solute-binding protein [Lysinibacter sp. HNR]
MNVLYPPARQHRPTVRRVLSVLGAAVTAMVALAACSLSPGETNDDSTLTIAVWKGYGADLPWVGADFKEKTGATLKFQYIDSEANMLQMVEKANGSIDVALPNIQYIGHGIDRELFHELDTARLQNFADIYPDFSGRNEIRRDGKLYGLPWTWGSAGLFCDSVQVAGPCDTLGVLWDPQYKGKIALIDDPTVLIPITALYLGLDPQNPDLDAITPALQELKENAKMTYSSSDDLVKAITSGAVVAGIGNSDTIGNLLASGVPGAENITYSVAKEGAVGWIDNWSISAKTKKLDLAYEWLNYMTGKEFLSTWAETPEDESPAPANKAVVDGFTPETDQRLQANTDKISQLALQLPQPEERMQSWVDAWTQVKASF